MPLTGAWGPAAPASGPHYRRRRSGFVDTDFLTTTQAAYQRAQEAERKRTMLAFVRRPAEDVPASSDFMGERFLPGPSVDLRKLRAAVEAGEIDVDEADEIVRATVKRSGGPSSPAILENLFSDLEDAAVGFIPGLVESVRNPIKSVKAVGQSYAHTYGPATSSLASMNPADIPGGFGETSRRIEEHPLGPLLDALTVGTLGAGAGVKAGLLPASAKTRFVGMPGVEGQVQKHASPNYLMRTLVEKPMDAWASKHPDVPLIGGRSVIARQLPKEGELELDRLISQGEPFAQSLRRLSKEEDVAAYFLSKFGADDPAGALAIFDQDLARREARLKDTDIEAAERRGQHRIVKKMQEARRYVEAPSDRMLAALAEYRPLEQAGLGVKEAAGYLTPEGAAEHLNLASRIATGASREPVTQTLEEALAQAKGTNADLGFVGKRVSVGPDSGVVSGISRGAPRNGSTFVEKMRADIADLDANGAPDADYLNLVASAARGIKWEKFPTRRDAVVDFVDRVELRLPVGADSAKVRFYDPAEGRWSEHDVPLGDLDLPGEGTRLVGGQDAAAGAAYLPDLARPSLGGLTSMMRSVTGKAKPLVKRSEGILFEQGRIRPTMKVGLEEFQRTMRHQNRLDNARKLGKFSRPMQAGAVGAAPGWRLFNPEGVRLKRSFTDQTEDAWIGKSPKELKDAIDAENIELSRQMFPDQTADLSPEVLAKVREVPEEFAKAFERGVSSDYGPVRMVMDTANDLAKSLYVYLKASYAPLNISSNLLLLTAERGVNALPDLMRSFGVLGDLSPVTLRMLDHEAGSGGALGLETGKSAVKTVRAGTRKLAEVQSAVADKHVRRAAMIGLMRRHGAKDEAGVQNMLTDPARKAELNQVAGEAERAMYRFRGLSHAERRIISRIIFLYPFLKASSRHAARLPLDKPGTADVVAHIGLEGDEEAREALGKVYEMLKGIVPLGDEVDGLLPVASQTAVTPYGTGLEVAQGVKANLPFVGEPSRKSSSKLANWLTPPLRAGLIAGSGYDPFRRREIEGDGFTTFGKALVGDPQTGIPNFPLAQTAQIATGTLPESKIYAKESGLLDAASHALLGSARPRTLKIDAAEEIAEKEYRSSLNVDARARYVTPKSVKTFRAGLAQAGIRLEDFERGPVDDALKMWERRWLAYAKEAKRRGKHLNGENRLTEAERLEIDLELARPKLEGWEIEQLEAMAAAGETRRVRDILRDKVFGQEALSNLTTAMKRAGVDVELTPPG